MTPDGGLSHSALLQEVSWIRKLARELVADRELAEDLVQETCVAALEHAPREPVKLRAWLAAVLRNALRQEARAHGRRTARERDGARPEALESTDRLVERVALQRQLVGAVLELDEPYRSAVLLRFFEDLPPREIARRTGVAVDTVNSRLQRGLARLRERLDGEQRAWALVFLPWIRGLEPAASSASLLPLLMNTKLVLGLAGAAAAGAFLWWSTSTSSEARAPSAAALAAAPGVLDRAAPVAPGGAAPAPTEAGEGAREPVAAPSVAAAAPAEPAPAPWTVELRVLDAEAQPLPGVEVCAVDSDVVLGTSGRGGWCVFPSTAPRLALAAAAARWVTIHEGRADRGGAYAPVLVVAPAMQLAGLVTDEPGQPLTGARIRFELPQGFDTRFADVMEASSSRSWIASSEDGGHFDLGRVPAVSGALVRAYLAGYEHDEVAAPVVSDDGLTLVLFRPKLPLAGVLRGTVLDQNGAFVPGARVGLGLLSVLSDEDGEFEMELKRAVTADTLTAVKAGFRPARLERPGPPKEGDSGWPEHVTLTLGAPALSISGVVLDHEGTPVSGARVWLHDPTPSSPVGFMPSDLEALMAGAPVPPQAIESEARMPQNDGDNFWDSVSHDDGPASAFWHFVQTAGDGSFELGGLDDRRYKLDVMAKDALLMTTSPAVAAGTHDAEIRLDAPDEYAELNGRVLGDDGRPIEGVVVQLMRPVVDRSARVYGGTSQVIKVRPGKSMVTDAEGRFHFTKVPRKGASLGLGADAIVPTKAEVTGAEMEVVVEQRCHLEVEVRDPVTRYDRMSLADGSGEGLDVLRITDGSVQANTHVPLVDGRSGVVSVSSRARMLLLYKDNVVIDTLPLALVPGEVNRVEP